jgi:hypothetical protein
MNFPHKYMLFKIKDLEEPKMGERTKGRAKLNGAIHVLALGAKWTAIFLSAFLLISILVLQVVCVYAQISCP